MAFWRHEVHRLTGNDRLVACLIEGCIDFCLTEDIKQSDNQDRFEYLIKNVVQMTGKPAFFVVDDDVVEELATRYNDKDWILTLAGEGQNQKFVLVEKRKSPLHQPEYHVIQIT